MRIDLGDDEPPEISLIALIDCIFFLLMFFMVATSFKHQADGRPLKELPITLPESAVSLDPATAAPDVVAIGVDAKGGVYWGRERVTQLVLRERLHAVAARNHDQAIRIDGDMQAPYQEIVHLMDLCQFEGLTRIAMRARDGR
ncbi:biopolymer transporter ExbD [Ideonella sp.]|uniref:ExbD/TolR family protein n=1 Tax=Ideonella sp. TaxID=1929293 RepID=UPI002B47176B|nr:biopolymer transporter ExbD [Ideonella sp.]HJV72310.1 biopolymer transporter ExbD [Ideonella sp.]